MSAPAGAVSFTSVLDKRSAEASVGFFVSERINGTLTNVFYPVSVKHAFGSDAADVDFQTDPPNDHEFASQHSSISGLTLEAAEARASAIHCPS
jgi:hypothetical protein